MRSQLLGLILLFSSVSRAATIAIIDTGFDLDHEFLKPKLHQAEIDEEALRLQGWRFHDNSHLKVPVTQDPDSVEEILRYRTIKAKGYRSGLTMEEFEWFKQKSADKDFMELVKNFKKQSHGTFVAGIALREGENISIFPIRGLSARVPVVAVEDSSPQEITEVKAATPEEKFQEEIRNSLDRVSKKFSKICSYIAKKNIEVVNASYGITFRSILQKFREKHQEITGKSISEEKLQQLAESYFEELYRRGEKTVSRYPKMLFVFSAGNSGLDNDRYHHYPSRIKAPNTLAVAAMNGDFLASFSNYGERTVDIGAPGVGIESVVPKVYSKDGADRTSPASGTSMAAPYISNVAAQVLNINSALTPMEVKRIILETGEEKLHLKPRLLSGSIVDNQRALKAAHLSREMSLDEAISLARFNLVPAVDKVSMGLAPAAPAEDLKKKVLDAVPAIGFVDDVLEEPAAPGLTSEGSSPPKGPVKVRRDKSAPPLLVPAASPETPADPIPASQSEGQSPPPSVVPTASSSQP
jgi:hypothetical protein